MAVWPTSLPQSVPTDGWSETSSGALLVTEMDVGPPKRRRRYTAARTVFTYSLILDTAQVATLRTFFESTLGMGVDAFDWVHPRTRAAASLAFLSDPAIQQAYGAGYWSVTFSLVLM